MKNLTSSTLKILEGAAKAFKRYPIVIANGLAFSIVTIIKIHMGWPRQEPFIFLFNSLNLAFVLGAIFSLTAITFVQSKYNSKKMFITANLLGIIVTVLTFFSLYLFGGIQQENPVFSYQRISPLAIARISGASFVSFLLFIILAGLSEEESDFSKSFFMVHKSFFIAAIYGLVTMAGVSGVAGAIKTLLYRGLSNNIYSYISVLSGFLAFTIFVGYFPDFRKGVIDKQREDAQKQPRFIEILFGYIITLIMLALTVVLILWTVKTVVGGMDVPFIRLSSIASSFAAGGIWLYIMLTHNDTGPAKFYKKTYPWTVMFILIFEAWALITQLQKYGLKTTEYLFILLWIFAFVSAILLIVKGEKTYNTVAAIVIVLTIISVLPYVGYNGIPVKLQVNRLEGLLKKEGILQEGKIIPATEEPGQDVRELITDSVIFLANSENAKLPHWFSKDLKKPKVFENTFGFELTHFTSAIKEPSDNVWTSLYFTGDAIDIREYRWGINMQTIYRKEEDHIPFKGNKGDYKIFWEENREDGMPSLKILLNEKTLLDGDLEEYITNILEKFPPGEMNTFDTEAMLEDMSIEFETSEVKVMIVFDNVYINKNLKLDTTHYRINPIILLLDEK